MCVTGSRAGGERRATVRGGRAIARGLKPAVAIGTAIVAQVVQLRGEIQEAYLTQLG